MGLYLAYLGYTPLEVWFTVSQQKLCLTAILQSGYFVSHNVIEGTSRIGDGKQSQWCFSGPNTLRIGPLERQFSRCS
ncbi:MAG: hypothetical protein WBA10_16180, partial [Elainellaceae cyanobacterium]